MSSYAESLVGQYFHIYDEDGLAENQGVVVERVGDDFICQYFLFQLLFLKEAHNPLPLIKAHFSLLPLYPGIYIFQTNPM